MTDTQAAEGAVFFFGAKHFLSQMYPSKFEHDGKIYETNEHFFQVAKAVKFNDTTTEAAMLATEDPKEAKKLGRKVKPFDKDVWTAVSYGLVVEANYLKFTKSEHAEQLAADLLATGNRELVEAAPRDRTWGIGFGAKNAEARRTRWGKNLLGKALMEVRARLRAEAADALGVKA